MSTSSWLCIKAKEFLEACLGLAIQSDLKLRDIANYIGSRLMSFIAMTQL